VGSGRRHRALANRWYEAKAVEASDRLHPLRPNDEAAEGMVGQTQSCCTWNRRRVMTASRITELRLALRLFVEQRGNWWVQL